MLLKNFATRLGLADHCSNGLKSNFAVVLGSQWGDEGKGKLVDILAKDYDLVCRFNGGNNAGHTVVADGHKYAFHLLPCGVLYPGVKNIVGNGTVVDVPEMFVELKQLDTNKVSYAGRFFVSDRAHLTTNTLVKADGKSENREES